VTGTVDTDPSLISIFAIIPFSVIRDIGQFGSVAVFWEIYNISSNTFNPNGTDFDDMRGSVIFKEGEKVKALTIIPKADGVPEFDEKFKIIMFNTSGKHRVSERYQFQNQDFTWSFLAC
jgi:hypothetical protein